MEKWIWCRNCDDALKNCAGMVNVWNCFCLETLFWCLELCALDVGQTFAPEEMKGSSFSFMAINICFVVVFYSL